jgi:acetylornithine/N-succinyldiaminopimelate aminotransferase
MAVGNAVLDLVLADGLFAHVTRMGELLMHGLQKLQATYPDKIRDVRGLGLILGIEPVGDARAIATKLLARGLVTSPTVTGVIRLVPPLIIEAQDVAEALKIIEDVIKE